jgi:hypothetical protein
MIPIGLKEDVYLRRMASFLTYRGLGWNRRGRERFELIGDAQYKNWLRVTEAVAFTLAYSKEKS